MVADGTTTGLAMGDRFPIDGDRLFFTMIVRRLEPDESALLTFFVANLLSSNLTARSKSDGRKEL
jgi:hypothetical protein